jgi:hypothetical protein
MPNRKPNCLTLYRLATQFNFDEQKNRISLTRQLSVDSAAARNRVCLCFAQVLARLVVQVRLKQNAADC